MKHSLGYTYANRTCSRLSRSNNGPVALCTLGLGLLHPLMVGKLSTNLSGWGEGGVRSLGSGRR